MVTPRNPIVRRLDRLHDQWTEFAQLADARMLIWRLEPAEAAMLEAFWARENDAQAAQTPDMFLRLRVPFEHPTAHGYALREALIAQYQEAEKALAQDPDVNLGWQCPAAAARDDDVRALVRALTSFHAHHAENIELLAVWLDPASVSDSPAYLSWLQRLLHEAPPQLRFFSADLLAAPAHEPLCRAEPKLVIAQVAQLDMASAMSEVSRQAGGLDTPGGQFRQLFVKLGEAANAGNVSLAQAIAERATALASAVGWPHLAASAQMVSAAALSGAGQLLEAAQAYTRVYAFGEQCEASAPATEDAEDLRAYGPRLRLQARLAQVGLLVQLEAYEHAAQAALQAAKIAEELEDTRAQLDALRLASFAYELHGAVDHAWASGMLGMALVQKMDDETRKNSTAPYLAQGLLRLTQNPSYESHREPLDTQFDKLLGRDWRTSLASPPPAPSGGE